MDFGSIDEPSLRREIAAIAERAGSVIKGRRGLDIELLQPRHASAALGPSLTAVYGLGTFPWHIDTAHLTIPARWMILGCLDPGRQPAATEITSLSSLPIWRISDRLHTTPFAYINGNRSFISTILQKDRPFARLDPGCMRPLTKEGDEILTSLSSTQSEASWSRPIDWIRGRVIIVDNWKFLHRRLDSSLSDGRAILRALTTDGVAHAQ